MSDNGALSITLLSVCAPGERDASQTWIDRASERFPAGELVRKVVEGAPITSLVLEEASKDYDLLLLGAPERDSRPDVLFSSVVDELVRGAPCLTMVVRGAGGDAVWAPRRILVPTDGAAAARHAAEIGFALAARGDAEVTVLHVVVHEPDGSLRDSRTDRAREVGIGYQIVQELGTLGESLGVRTRLAVEVGTAPEAVILEVAAQRAIDLIILGTAVRGSHRLFVGSRVERVLNAAPARWWW
jgi:nucleotide-binding universal stress UspA family protein